MPPRSRASPRSPPGRCPAVAPAASRPEGGGRQTEGGPETRPGRPTPRWRARARRRGWMQAMATSEAAPASGSSIGTMRCPPPPDDIQCQCSAAASRAPQAPSAMTTTGARRLSRWRPMRRKPGGAVCALDPVGSAECPGRSRLVVRAGLYGVKVRHGSCARVMRSARSALRCAASQV